MLELRSREGAGALLRWGRGGEGSGVDVSNLHMATFDGIVDAQHVCRVVSHVGLQGWRDEVGKYFPLYGGIFFGRRRSARGHDRPRGVTATDWVGFILVGGPCAVCGSRGICFICIGDRVGFTLDRGTLFGRKGGASVCVRQRGTRVITRVGRILTGASWPARGVSGIGVFSVVSESVPKY